MPRMSNLCVELHLRVDVFKGHNACKRSNFTRLYSWSLRVTTTYLRCPRIICFCCSTSGPFDFTQSGPKRNGHLKNGHEMEKFYPWHSGMHASLSCLAEKHQTYATWKERRKKTWCKSMLCFFLSNPWAPITATANERTVTACSPVHGTCGLMNTN